MIDDQYLIIREQEGLDQLLILHFDLTKFEKSTFNIDISEGKHPQHKKVFLVGFYDPFGDYLELMSSIDIKIFLSDDSWFCHPFETTLLHARVSFSFWVKIKGKFNRSFANMASLEA